MNDYISKREKIHIVRLGAVMNAKDEAIADYSKSKKIDKEYLKAINMMGSFAFRALKIRMSYLNQEAAGKLLQDTLKNSIVVQWKDSAMKDYERALRLDENVAIRKDHFHSIIEYTIEGFCKKCDGTVKDCPLKVLFNMYEVPIPYNDVPDGTCIYNYMSKKPVLESSIKCTSCHTVSTYDQVGLAKMGDGLVEVCPKCGSMELYFVQEGK